MCGSQRIHHVLGLLIRVEIRMVAQAGGVITGVVRSDDDVASSRTDGCERQAFLVALACQVGNVERLEGPLPMGVQHNRSRALTSRMGARGYHQCRGGGGGLTPGADGVVLEMVGIDGAGRREGELDQLPAQLAAAQPGEQIRDRKRAELGRWAVEELPAGGGERLEWRHAFGAAAAAWGEQRHAKDQWHKTLFPKHRVLPPCGLAERNPAKEPAAKSHCQQKETGVSMTCSNLATQPLSATPPYCPVGRTRRAPTPFSMRPSSRSRRRARPVRLPCLSREPANISVGVRGVDAYHRVLVLLAKLGRLFALTLQGPLSTLHKQRVTGGGG